MPLTFTRRRWSVRYTWDLLLRFVVLQAKSLVFAGTLFIGLTVMGAVEMPIPRYDAMLILAVVLTFVLWVTKRETTREVAVIAGFHLIGLALEIYKVHEGSWIYPDDAWTKVAGVPLYSGFMYAAVGSYICQAWRRFNLRVTGYLPWALTAVAVLIYANFFTHHFWPDVRWLLAGLMLLALRRTWVHFSIGEERVRMPLTLSFVFIGLALYVAENAGTFLGAWQYPNQVDVWELVHAGKFGSWALLVSLSFALIATVKSGEGKLYGDADDQASVVRAYTHSVARHTPGAPDSPPAPQAT